MKCRTEIDRFDHDGRTVYSAWVWVCRDNGDNVACVHAGHFDTEWEAQSEATMRRAETERLIETLRPAIIMETLARAAA